MIRCADLTHLPSRVLSSGSRIYWPFNGKKMNRTLSCVSFTMNLQSSQAWVSQAGHELLCGELGTQLLLRMRNTFKGTKNRHALHLLLSWKLRWRDEWAVCGVTRRVASSLLAMVHLEPVPPASPKKGWHRRSLAVPSTAKYFLPSWHPAWGTAPKIRLSPHPWQMPLSPSTDTPWRRKTGGAGVLHHSPCHRVPAASPATASHWALSQDDTQTSGPSAGEPGSAPWHGSCQDAAGRQGVGTFKILSCVHNAFCCVKCSMCCLLTCKV